MMHERFLLATDFSLIEMDSHDKIIDKFIPTEHMNNLIFDYLLSNGHTSIAVALQNDIAKTKFQNDHELTIHEDSDIREKIRDHILSGEIKEAEKVINSSYPELLDDDHLLHFYLQIQHLIELVRQRKIEQAVTFAQEDIVEKGDYPECLPDLERVMGLLAYSEPETSPFADLLKPNFRLKVWSRVNEAIRNTSREPTSCRLDKLLRYVLWSQQVLQDKNLTFNKMVNYTDVQFKDSTES
jgi:hypothetical protein